MKKSLFAALALSALLFACSKEKTTQDKPAPSGKKVPINVSITDFVKKVEQLPSPLGRKSNLSAKDSVLSTEISDIYFFVFESHNQVVDFIHQRSTDDNFGIIADSLPEGNYRVGLVASTDSLTIIGGSVFTNQPDETMAPTPFPDVFYKGADITVSAGGNNIYDLSLERIVGFLEVNIGDAPAISADSSVKVSLRFENSYFTPIYGDSYSGAFLIPMNIPRRSQQVFNAFVMSTYADVFVDIIYPDRTTGALLTKTINYVGIDKNAKTILSGNLYSAPPVPEKFSNGFNVSINKIWGPSNEIGF